MELQGKTMMGESSIKNTWYTNERYLLEFI